VLSLRLFSSADRQNQIGRPRRFSSSYSLFLGEQDYRVVRSFLVSFSLRSFLAFYATHSVPLRSLSGADDFRSTFATSLRPPLFSTTCFSRRPVVALSFGRRAATFQKSATFLFTFPQVLFAAPSFYPLAGNLLFLPVY